MTPTPPYLLIAGIAFIILGGFLLLSGQQIQSVQSYQSLNSSTSSNLQEIIYNGSESGVNLGTVQKGQTITLTYLSGKIISNTKTGWSSPIWGVPQSQTNPYWVKGLPYKEMNTDALFVELNGQRVPFRSGINSISVTATAKGTAWLKMNDSLYDGNAGNARFSVTVR
jgi:hypothetical protein